MNEDAVNALEDIKDTLERIYTILEEINER